MSEADDLGPAEPWQIKQFPRRLRQELTEQAHTERVSVGELLTRLVIAAREGGWQFDPSRPSPDGSTNGVEAGLALAERAIAAAVALASAPNVPVTFRRRANRLLRESLPSRSRKPASLPSSDAPPREIA
jgi:adenine/guanine phosphoribosyltransferase-like PRPP-binding protein